MVNIDGRGAAAAGSCGAGAICGDGAGGADALARGFSASGWITRLMLVVDLLAQ